MINAQSTQKCSGSEPDQGLSIAEGARGLPLAVEIRRRMSRSGRWSVPAWEAASVVCGASLESGSQGGASVQALAPAVNEPDEGGEVRRYLVGGLKLQLFVDGCESYWYNLQGDAPKLFVVCFQEDEADTDTGLGLTPALVTASSDEAGAHMESDDPVFAVPMPALAMDWVERFVVSHYVPVIKKKRRRREWQSESQYGKRGAAPADRERP